MYVLKRFKIIFIILWVSLTTDAQYLETGITAGGSLYTGDLNPSPAFSLIQPAGGVIVRYNLTTRWVWKNTLLFGKLKGDDTKGENLWGRSLQFQSNLTEISSQIEFNFLNYFTGSRRENFSPYLFTGLSLFMFNPKAPFEENWIELQPLKTEGQDTKAFPDRKPYSKISMSIPFGLGIKYGIGKKLCIGLETGYRKTLTDYIDDVSTTYYLEGDQIDPTQPEEILSDPLRNHSSGMQRGNSRNKDWYAYGGIFITYKFNLYKTPPCNDFRNIQRFE
ncbi:MAG: Uncharacterized protein XD81_1355 [Bacteroidetes bacterium 38_7]|nr:MAG: Uncharacterized protein XD81_1355 [Bacteroidetes bacterium 38_7]HAL64262.1 hypothetical protein [Bacteroidales bacterium]